MAVSLTPLKFVTVRLTQFIEDLFAQTLAN